MIAFPVSISRTVATVLIETWNNFYNIYRCGVVALDLAIFFGGTISFFQFLRAAPFYF